MAKMSARRDAQQAREERHSVMESAPAAPKMRITTAARRSR